MRKLGQTRFTAIDLFSGCGGLTQGLRDAGFSVLAAVEIDSLASITYRSNHPDVRLLESDIRKISGPQLLKATGISPGELDLLAGCPPCQGFSRLPDKNRRRRLADPRNRLIDDMLRLIESLRPKTVMIENVPNLSKYSRYANFKRRLRELGYNVTDAVLDVADFGVPQRRKRLVVLASSLGTLSHPAPAKSRKTVRDAIAGLPPPKQSEDPLNSLTEARSERIAALIRRVPRNGGSRTDLPRKFALKCHREIDGYFDVYGRMAWDDVSPTITGGCINPSKGRFLHPEADRAITLREAALLQSFPSGYRFSLDRGKYAAAEMIGNALPPVFSRIQARSIKLHLTSARARP